MSTDDEMRLSAHEENMLNAATAKSRLTSALAAANQQLDAMRAEVAKERACSDAAEARVEEFEACVSRLRSELAALRQSTEADCSEHHRLAHESLQREYVALEADRDTWKKTAEHIADRLSQSTEADAKRERTAWGWAWVSDMSGSRGWMYPNRKSAIASLNGAIQDTTVKLVKVTCYRRRKRPAPVAPAPGTSEAVAWRSDVHKGFITRRISIVQQWRANGVPHTPLYAAPPAPARHAGRPVVDVSASERQRVRWRVPEPGRCAALGDRPVAYPHRPPLSTREGHDGVRSAVHRGRHVRHARWRVE